MLLPKLIHSSGHASALGVLRFPGVVMPNYAAARFQELHSLFRITASEFVSVIGINQNQIRLANQVVVHKFNGVREPLFNLVGESSVSKQAANVKLREPNASAMLVHFSKLRIQVDSNDS